MFAVRRFGLAYLQVNGSLSVLCSQFSPPQDGQQNSSSEGVEGSWQGIQS